MEPGIEFICLAPEHYCSLPFCFLILRINMGLAFGGVKKGFESKGPNWWYLAYHFAQISLNLSLELSAPSKEQRRSVLFCDWKADTFVRCWMSHGSLCHLVFSLAFLNISYHMLKNAGNSLFGNNVWISHFFPPRCLGSAFLTLLSGSSMWQTVLPLCYFGWWCHRLFLSFFLSFYCGQVL